MTIMDFNVYIAAGGGMTTRAFNGYSAVGDGKLLPRVRLAIHASTYAIQSTVQAESNSESSSWVRGVKSRLNRDSSLTIDEKLRDCRRHVQQMSRVTHVTRVAQTTRAARTTREICHVCHVTQTRIPGDTCSTNSMRSIETCSTDMCSTHTSGTDTCIGRHLKHRQHM